LLFNLPPFLSPPQWIYDSAEEGRRGTTQRRGSG
jgi:hypothetical protein